MTSAIWVVVSVVVIGVNNQVVVRVAIIRDEHAPVWLAGELNGVGVDAGNGSDVRLSVDLDHSVVLVHSGGGKLRVHVALEAINVPTGDTEVNSVGGIRDCVSVDVVEVVVVLVLLGGVVDGSVSVHVHGWVVGVHDDIVVEVAIIRDESATSGVAGELDL